MALALGLPVFDVFTDLSVAGTFTTGATVTVGSGAAEDTKVVFDGNAQDFYIGLDDSADDLVIGKGSTVGTTPAVEIDENLDIKFAESIGVGQGGVQYDWRYRSSNNEFERVQRQALRLVTAVRKTQRKLVYDGNAKDFYMGLDDSADKLVVGVGSGVGTNSILTLDDDSVTIGDGAAVDTKNCI